MNRQMHSFLRTPLHVGHVLPFCTLSRIVHVHSKARKGSLMGQMSAVKRTADARNRQSEHHLPLCHMGGHSRQ